MSLKKRISSPLEAGPSIHDAHHLPPHLTAALEYTSSRLAKKSLHLTLVVVRRDYQLPSILPPAPSPTLSDPSTPGSPPPSAGSTGSSRFGFASTPVFALRQLVRSASQHASFSSNRPHELSRSVTSPAACTTTGLESPSPRFRWPLSPTTPSSPLPMTPSTTSSLATTETNGPQTPNSLGLRFLHASDISPKAEKMLRDTLSKAGNKHGVGSAWLTPFACQSARELSNQLFHSSVIQNEVLFSSDGLTLLALDHLYSVKSALSSYSKTAYPLRLEDAVDELRRLVLASNGAKVARSDLVRSYDWLSVSNSAITDLDRMYRRAYGGPELMGGISGMPTDNIFEPVVYKPTLSKEEEADHDDEGIGPRDTILVDDGLIGIAVTTAKALEPPVIQKIASQLKLRTSFESEEKPQVQCGEKKEQVEESEEQKECTTCPIDRSAIHMWNRHLTIDHVLSTDTSSLYRKSMALGPTTPNADDDISPITRGEWGFLMVDHGFKGGRTVAVETF